MASKQRRIMPTMDSWIVLGCSDILPLSFIKHYMDGTHMKVPCTSISSLHFPGAAFSLDQARITSIEKYTIFEVSVQIALKGLTDYTKVEKH